MDLELIPVQARQGVARAGIPRAVLAALLALTVAQAVLPQDMAIAQTQDADKPPAPKPAPIDRNGVLILIRSALLALDQANKTGNYTVLRDLGAPGFQVNTAARLAEIFARQRERNLDLSGVAVIDPQLSLLPQIEPNGMMHMAGSFPSIPSPVDFELVLASVNGQWRLFGISVSIGHTASTPAAQAGSPPADDGKSSRVGKQKHRVLAAPKQP